MIGYGGTKSATKCNLNLAYSNFHKYVPFAAIINGSKRNIFLRTTLDIKV